MSAQAITFVVSGQPSATRGEASAAVAPLGNVKGRVKASARLSAKRAGGETQRLSAVPGEDVVLLQLANGPVLVLHPETARDLLLGQGQAKRGGDADGGEVQVPAQLRWNGLEQAAPARTRGFLGDVVLKAVEVVTGLATDAAADFVASRVVAKVDGQVNAGVYALQPDSLPALKAHGVKLSRVPPADGPMLVLLHGTFVDTASTFGKLWTMHPAAVGRLFEHYEHHVYALDHPTLGASPIANALTLAQALPPGARLHLATHSRGGLVAEVLARLSGQGGELTPADLACFDGAAHAGQRDELRALAALVKQRALRVDRVVRVACPARGTLLASRRLDAYLSVLKWGLELAGVPVAPDLLDFLTEVARRREDPNQLPGLAAMVPGSPLVQWLNSGGAAFAGDLRVVAGDLEGDSIGSWLKTLLADAFYWTDNDIVVQTRSMYGGTPREEGARFFLDQGGKVTHFNYFANERSAGAIVNALTQDEPAGFRPIGPLSWAGDDSSGLRAARRPRDDGSAAHDKPALFVLPGMFGSHLKVGDRRLWLSQRLVGALGQLAYHEAEADKVQEDGPIGLIYDRLIEHLQATHEVIPFGYDWRRPLEDEAQRLAGAVQAALDARRASGQPVRIVAHSMGGLLARTMQLERPEVWQRMMAQAGARLLMLGTPNGGCWAPMQALSGDDGFGNALAAFGAPLQDRQARQLMAGFPGLMQLQAGLLDPELGLERHATWAGLAQDDLQRVRDASAWHHNVFGGDDAQPQIEACAWGLPPQPVLDRALALRRRLDAQRDQVLPKFADRIVMVTGQAELTPDGFELGDGGLVYRNLVRGGDGRVPLPLALLPGVPTWTLDAEHDRLPDSERGFDAFVDLLERGDTRRLPRLDDGARGAGGRHVTHLPSRPSRGLLSGARPADSMTAVFSASGAAEPKGGSAAVEDGLRVTVLNGNLKFLPQPLMLGHYRSAELSGTEAVVDRLLGGSMSASLALGLYPDAPGSQQVFTNARRDPDNPWRAPRPASVIVVGLGSEGALTALALAESVRRGVVAWSLRLADEPEGAPGVAELAATLLGSGSQGMSPGAVAAAIASGVRAANEQLAERGGTRVDHLVLVELYLERATEAWRHLQVQSASTPGRYQIAPAVVFGTGALRRQLDTGYRGADYDLISVETGGADADDGSFVFKLNTRRARSELTAQKMQARLVRNLVAEAAHDASTDTQIGHTLFQLLVPESLEPFLGGTDNMVLELDQGSAGIPWELLDAAPARSASGAHPPWAIRTKLLRKLRSDKFRARVDDAQADDAVLVIGEPWTGDARYPELPGALAEAKAVAAALSGDDGVGAGRVTALLDGANAASILNALLARRYRIVHIAGHGEAGPAGGVVLSEGSKLGPREIEAMRTVPELVFVNCCHLAAIDGQALLTPLNRAEFAAGVAEQLIQIGVRCVVAAGWAVEDEPAKHFSTTLYRELLAGSAFIDAVARAREAAWRFGDGGNTWAAYQCYGDPHWCLRRGVGDAQAASESLHKAFDAIASPPELTMALEAQALRSRYGDGDPAAGRAVVRHLEVRFGASWPGMGAVAEAFGLAYAELRDLDTAIDWYRRATQCNDASASMKCAEQLANLQVRRAWERAERGEGSLSSARREMTQALATLDALISLQATPERHSLRGSAWKRLAMLDRLAQRSDERALAEMASSYGAAVDLAGGVDQAGAFYPAINLLTAQTVSKSRQPLAQGLDENLVEPLRASLRARMEADPDFWILAGVLELDMLVAVAAGRLAASLPQIDDGFERLRQRVGAPHMWRSVADNARFVLTPYVDTLPTGPESRAVSALLARLQAHASSGPSTEPLSTVGAATAGKRQRRAPTRTKAPVSDAPNVVLWDDAKDPARAAALVAALQARGQQVWQRSAVKPDLRASDLALALRTSRLVLVWPGQRPVREDPAVLDEFTLIQQAAWRPGAPVNVVSVISGAARPPAFLRRADTFDPELGNLDALLARLER